MIRYLAGAAMALSLAPATGGTIENVEPDWWSQSPPWPVEVTDRQAVTAITAHAEALRAERRQRLADAPARAWLARAEQAANETLAHPEAAAQYRAALGKAMVRLNYFSQSAPARQIASAQRALARGSWLEAEALLRRLAASEDLKVAAEASFQLGLAQLAQYRYPTAWVLLRQAADRVPLAAVYQHTAGAMAYRLDGGGEQAIHYLRRAARSAERLLGRRNATALRFSHDLARALSEAGEYAEAEQLYQQALVVYREAPKRFAAIRIDTHLQLASIVEGQGRLEDAVQHYREALRSLDSQGAAPPTTVLEALERLAINLDLLGDTQAAQPLYERALRIRESQAGDDVVALASELQRLADVYSQGGEHARAVVLLERALELLRRTPAAAQGLVRPMQSLAALYEALERHADAEAMYAAAAHQERQDARTWKDTDAVQALIEYYRAQQRYRDAIPLLEQRLADDQRRHGAGHAILAKRFAELGAYQAADADFDAAQASYRHALSIAERAFGRDDPEIVPYAYAMARIDFVLGHNEKAEILFKRILRIREQRPSNEFPDLETIRAGYATLRTGTDENAAILPDANDRSQSADQQ